MNTNKIIQGDSLSVLKNMPGGKKHLTNLRYYVILILVIVVTTFTENIPSLRATTLEGGFNFIGAFMPRGVFIRSEEYKRKMREIGKKKWKLGLWIGMLNKKHSKETKEKQKNSHLGKSWITKKGRKKLSRIHKGRKNLMWNGGKFVICNICNKKFRVPLWRFRKSKMLFCSIKCLGKWISLNKKGEKSPAWKGGITPITNQIRHSDKYKMWRLGILRRDNFTCQKCGENKKGKIQVHHKIALSKLFRKAKKYSPLFNYYTAIMVYSPIWNMKNGITLCEKCHKKTVNYGNKKKEMRQEILL